MWNTDSFGWQESTDPIYKDVPFFLDVNHGHALGVFLDNTFRTNFDFGRADLARYTFGALDGPATYYLLYGPEPKQVVTAWAWLTGPTPLPPIWGPRFPAVALLLLPGVPAARGRRPPPKRPHPVRRPLARHRLPA